MWHSDFGIYSQIILAFVLLESAAELRGLTPSSARFRKVFTVFFCIVYFGSKIKGDVRLAPLFLLAHLANYDRKRLASLWPWLSASLLATLPWSLAMFKHLPPLLGGERVIKAGLHEQLQHSAASSSFLASGIFSWNSAPLSLLGALGLISLLAVAPGHRWATRVPGLRVARSRQGNRAALGWLGFSVLALGLVSPQNPTFELRYTLVPLVPGVLLLAHALETLNRDFARVRGFGPALAALLLVQCGLQFRHAAQHRVDMGHTIVGIDGIFSSVEALAPGFGKFVLGPGFPPITVTAGTRRRPPSRTAASVLG